MTHPVLTGLARLAVGSAVVATSVVITAPTTHAAESKTVFGYQIDVSETRATGHNDITADGVHVYTEGNTSTDKAAGYFDVDMALAAAGEPAMTWTPSDPVVSNNKPGMQLKVDFDGDGSIDGILVGEPTYQDGTPLYGSDWWASNGSKQFVKDGAPSHDGGFGSSNHGTLDGWRAAFPDANVIQSGWSMGSGVRGDGTIGSIAVGETTYSFAASPATTVTDVYESDVDPGDTRATGHNDFLDDGGVRVWTEGATSTDKAAGYFAAGIALADAGEPRMAWTPNNDNAGGNVRPGLQLVTDFDGDGTPDGILVGEPTYADGTPLYGTDWWLSNSSAQFVKDLAPSHTGGFGSDNHGQLSEWRAAFPDATVVAAGWSLGSGVHGDGIISSITVGLTEFRPTGANRAPSASPVTAQTVAGKPVTVTLAATDPDGDELTFSSEDGTVVGDQLTYDTPSDARGAQTLTYTVTDGEATSESTVVVRVGKAPTTMTLSVTPEKPSTTSRNIKGLARVTTTGAAGGKVRLFDKDDRVAVGDLRPNGTVVLKVEGTLTKGRHKLVAVYGGNAFTQDATASDVIVVVKKK